MNSLNFYELDTLKEYELVRNRSIVVFFIDEGNGCLCYADTGAVFPITQNDRFIEVRDEAL